MTVNRRLPLTFELSSKSSCRRVLSPARMQVHLDEISLTWYLVLRKTERCTSPSNQRCGIKILESFKLRFGSRQCSGSPTYVSVGRWSMRSSAACRHRETSRSTSRVLIKVKIKKKKPTQLSTLNHTPRAPTTQILIFLFDFTY